MRPKLALVLVTLASIALAPSPASATKRPIQLSLVTPIQIFPPSDVIAGFRFNLLYGRNAGLTGFDLGLVNHIEGEVRGGQVGLVAIVEGKVTGVQYSAASLTVGEITGAQLGGFNYARRMHGLQLGLVNYAESIHGIQIGIVNIIRSGGWLPVMVIVNGSL